MSTSVAGRAIRSFMAGSKDCPPAIAFASGVANASSASSRLVTRT
jgi:hypothetical protein